jgi:hypothetical protein
VGLFVRNGEDESSMGIKNFLWLCSSMFTDGKDYTSAETAEDNRAERISQENIRTD